MNMFFLCVCIISSYFFIMAATSLDFSALSAFSVYSSPSVILVLIIEYINCCLIFCLLSLLVFLAFSEPCFNHKPKNNHYTANLKHFLQTENAMRNLILRLY